jgi:hypothetical protein
MSDKKTRLTAAEFWGLVGCLEQCASLDSLEKAGEEKFVDMVWYDCLQKLADREARDRGYQNWQDAAAR